MNIIMVLAALTLAVATAEGAPEPGANSRPTDPIVSPSAAQQVDEEDLVRKLTGEERRSDLGPEARLDRIVERMGDSAQRLKQQDPGEVTQEIGRRIILDLDLLIDMARKCECGDAGTGNSKPRGGEPRTDSRNNPRTSPASTGGTNAAENSQLVSGTSAAAPGALISDRNRAAWYGLPAKDREYIVQGMKESILPSYEVMMAHFYETLAKNNKPR